MALAVAMGLASGALGHGAKWLQNNVGADGGETTAPRLSPPDSHENPDETLSLKALCQPGGTPY